MSIFDKEYKRYDSWYDKNIFAYLSELNLLKKIVPKNEKGLEVGVGTAKFASKLETKVGIDPSFNMIKIARKRGIKCAVARAENLPFRDNSFDYLMMIITICFINNPAKALSEARRVLKEKGKIFIGLVDKMSFLGKFYRQKESIFYKKANFFSISSLTRLLNSQGFSNLFFHQTIFSLPSELNKADSIKNGFGKGGFVVVGARNVSL